MGAPTQLPNGTWVDSQTGAPVPPPAAAAQAPGPPTAPAFDPTVLNTGNAYLGDVRPPAVAAASPQSVPGEGRPPAQPKPAPTALPADRLTAPPAPPAPGTPGAALTPQTAAVDQALANLVAPGAGGAAHPQGLSPADRAFGESLGQRAQGLADAIEGAQDTHDKAIDAFQKQSDIALTQSQAALDETRRQNDEVETRRRAIADDYSARQREIQADLTRQTAMGIDPLRGMTHGQQVMAGIAIALGALGAGPLGPRGAETQNQALNIINGAIDRNVKLQTMALERSLDITKTKAAESGNDFARQMAMVNGERDAVLKSYEMTDQQIQRTLATHQANAQLQMEGAKVRALLAQQRDERIGPLMDKTYAIAKQGEKLVGGGAGIDRQKLLKEAADQQDKAAANGVDLSWEEAMRKGAQRLGLRLPGELTPTDVSKKPGGKGIGGKGAVVAARFQGAAEAASKIEAMVSQSHTGFLTPAENAQVEAWNKEIEEAGLKPIPSGMFAAGALGSAKAAARATQEMANAHVRNIKTFAAGGGGGEEEPAGENEPDPEEE